MCNLLHDQKKHTHHSHIRQLIERNPEKAKERVGKELDVTSIIILQEGLLFSIEMYINTFEIKGFSPILNFHIFTSKSSWTLKNKNYKREMEEFQPSNLI